MEPIEKHKNTRLNPSQKKMLDLITKSTIFKSFPLPSDLSFDSIDITNFKLFNDLHSKINTILLENKIEPHEIFNLLNTYDGSNEDFDRLKRFIVGRNLMILKRIYGSDQWVNNILHLVNKLKIIYIFDKKMVDILDTIIMNLLLKDITMFDITQCKIILDSKNNLKKINISSISDQKYIITELSLHGYKKK